MTIREELEIIELGTLCEDACTSKHTGRRVRPEPQCPIRTDFQRDRDRILHCNAFRRLKHKTQVFLSPQGDHYRTRLTHTLEVSQIARTLSRALRLNEDLTEAIALGHDLGHTPFGHAGEYALQDVYDPNFHHAAQSVRVVTLLEREGRGLNLTEETPNGSSYNVSSEEQAHALLNRIIESGMPLIKYELREPSLNEIFIEKVGNAAKAGESDEK